MAPFPSPISLIRRGGTPMARASAVCDNAIGFRNSSSRISPGCGLGKSSAVVIDDLDIVSASFGPVEADAPLVIDTNAPLSDTIAPQSFEAVAGWHAQIVDPFRGTNEAQLAQRAGLDRWRELSAA